MPSILERLFPKENDPKFIEILEVLAKGGKIRSEISPESRINQLFEFGNKQPLTTIEQSTLLELEDKELIQEYWDNVRNDDRASYDVTDKGREYLK